MCLEKGRPGRSSAALWRRLNPIALQHVGNRPATNLVTEIGQRSLNAGVAPLLRNQAPMPPQQGIRRDYGVEFKQGFAPYRLGLARQKSTLSVGEPDSLSS